METQNTEIINRISNNQRTIRGLACIIIIFCHTRSFYFDGFTLVQFFNPLGFISVAIFYFFSGYNFISSIKDGWNRGFWKKKFVRIYIPFVIGNMLWYLKDYFNDISIKGLLSCCGVNIYNDTLWFCYSILVFYFIAWFVFIIADKFFSILNLDVIVKRIVISALSFVVYFVFKHIWNNIVPQYFPTMWLGEVGSTFSLLVGMIIAIWREELIILSGKFKKGYDIFHLVAMFTMFTCLYSYWYYGDMDPRKRFMIVFWGYLALGFTIWYLCINCNLSNWLISTINKCSYEIYCLHATMLALAVSLFNKINLNADIILVVYACVLVCLSYALNCGLSKLVKRVCSR